MASSKNFIYYDATKKEFICSGDWNLENIRLLEDAIAKLALPKEATVTINASDIKKMDSAGAFVLNKFQNELDAKKINTTVTNFSEKHAKLLKLIQTRLKQEGDKPLQRTKTNFLEEVGQYTIQALNKLFAYLAFVGQLTFEAIRIASHPKHWRWNSLASVIYRTGFQGLPIIALLSFLIGVVITYQMGLQLKNYGANIYIVDLLGLSILREFAPLITAIMVAGRTGSAFTASIGMMKLNQEIDALDTMGVTPAELLLLPRILGLTISLPLLVMWSDVFGVFGGMVMSNNMLNISWYDFLHRFPHVIPLRSFIIGIGKAPVFALLISSIGCFEGMKVKNSADSVGENTTRSVVLAIFFIIVADAIFSVIFSKMKL